MLKEFCKYALCFLFIACVHATASQDPSLPPVDAEPQPSPTATPEPAPEPSPVPPPPTPAPTPPIGMAFLNPTIYYKPTIVFDKSTCPNDVVDMLDPKGNVLVNLCGPDFRNCLMQGACFVYDDQGRFRSFNYYARGEDESPRFKEVNIKKCPYGFGVRNSCLDPYFTVAADLKIYKPGDVIFVPRLVGVLVPTGDIHDGFLIVRDRGAAIVGISRFDFFTGFEGLRDRANIFVRMGFANKANQFEYRMATEEEAQIVRERQGYPGINRQVVLPPVGPPAPPRRGQQPSPTPSPTPTPPAQTEPVAPVAQN